MWPRTPLGGLCDAGQYGLNAAALKEGGGVRFIRITDIDASGQLGGADPAYVPATTPELDRYELSFGDLLIARSGATAGKSMLFRGLSERAVFAGYLIRFKARADLVLPEYLAYYMQSPAYWRYIRKTARAVAQPNINARELASLPVPLAPPTDQRRIVDLLSRAENIVRMRREAESKAKEIIPALFLDMFGDPARNERGWEVRRLGEIVERFQGGKNVEAGASGDSEFRILKISAVTSGKYDELEAKPAPSGFSPPPHYFVREGDILFSRANTEELVGATAMVVSTDGKSLLPDKLWRLVWRPDARVRPAYMLALLQNRSTRKALSKIASGTGGSMKNISQAKLSELRLPIAPMDAQITFERNSESVKSLLGGTQRAGTVADQAFQSLLAGVFGEGA